MFRLAYPKNKKSICKLGSFTNLNFRAKNNIFRALMKNEINIFLSEIEPSFLEFENFWHAFKNEILQRFLYVRGKR